MPVQVNLPTVLRSHAGGAKAVSVEGATVGQVLVALADQYPGLSGQVINGEGEVKRGHGATSQRAGFHPNKSHEHQD